MARPWGLVVHGGTSIGPMEVKLKDYLDGATVLFDAAGNVVDGRLQGDYNFWRGLPGATCPIVRWRRFHGRYVSQDSGSFDPIASG